MRKSLIIIVISILLLQGMGGCNYMRDTACKSTNISQSTISALPTRAVTHNREKIENHHRSEILDIPAEDDLFQRPFIYLESLTILEQEKKNYFDCHVSDYPWTIREINTPPPRA